MSLIDYSGIFKNEDALTYEFVPKVLPFRENEQQEIVNAIKPVLDKRDGRNLLIYGIPGIGKTAATKNVLRELEEKSDVYPIYINAWKYNTSYKFVIELAHQVGYMLTANKSTNEILEKVASILNRNGSVIVIDEIDKLDDTELLYSLQEDLYRKSLIMITNYREWYSLLDQRLRSRLLPTELYFKPYSLEEVRTILSQRIDYAFKPNVWNKQALSMIVEKTFRSKDIRIGLFLLRESGRIAEQEFSSSIEERHVEKALALLPEFTASNIELEDKDREILELVKSNPGRKIGELFELYKKSGGSLSYKSFQRRINKLADGKYISIKKTHSGGNTTIIDRKINDYE